MGIKKESKYIMTVIGKEFEHEDYVYVDDKSKGNFIGTLDEFKAIKQRIEREGYYYQIYKLIPINVQ